MVMPSYIMLMLRTVPITMIPKYFYDYTCQEKQILGRAIEIQKENWGLPRIFQR